MQTQPGLRRDVIRYFAVTLSVSWLAWLPLVLARCGAFPDAPRWLFFLGAAGPLSGAIVTTWRQRGGPGLRALLGRMTSSPGGTMWLALSVVVPLGIAAAAALVTLLVDGRGPPLSLLGVSSAWPELGAWFGVIQFLTFAVGEETGWRGVLLPLLQHRFTPFKSTVVTTLMWAFWHIPLFVMNTGGLQQMRGWSVLGWLVSLFPGAVVLTWLANRSRSILVAILFHGTINLAFTLPAGELFQSASGALLTLFSLVLLARSRWLVPQH